MVVIVLYLYARLISQNKNKTVLFFVFTIDIYNNYVSIVQDKFSTRL